jgi:hypothetical protein
VLVAVELVQEVANIAELVPIQRLKALSWISHRNDVSVDVRKIKIEVAFLEMFLFPADLTANPLELDIIVESTYDAGAPRQI